jgi:phosphate acetyltransferase
MSRILEEINMKAAKLYKHIVLAEGEEERNVCAAAMMTARKIAKITLIGDPDAIVKKYKDVNFTGIEIINPKKSPKREKYAELLYEIRKEKGMTQELAEKTAEDPMYFATLMLKAGDADGMVSGAVHSTGDVLRPSFADNQNRSGLNGFKLLPYGIAGRERQSKNNTGKTGLDIRRQRTSSQSYPEQLVT